MDTAAVAVLQVVAAGERRFARQGSLCVLFTTANERAGRCEAHRGPVVAGAAAQGGRRRGWAAAQAELGDGDDTEVLQGS